METTDPRGYDIDNETAASRDMLERRIPTELNAIKLALVDIDKKRSFEPWRLALTFDLVDNVERNCEQLLEMFGKDRFPATAWIARNLLELLIWVKYCAVSRENAWRFHEDALRDTQGLMEAHKRILEARGIADEIFETAVKRIQELASEQLDLEQIDSKYLPAAEASRAPGVDLNSLFAPSHRWLSNFAHPTAVLVHGMMHRAEVCRQLQAVCTTQGVYFAAQSTLALESQLGIPSPL